jgi:hypothetical protein
MQTCMSWFQGGRIPRARALGYTWVMLKRALLLLITGSLPAFGQLTPNSLTVTATRNNSLQPDQVIFSLSLTTGLDATRDDAIAALQGLSITPANFNGVNTVQSYTGQSSQTLLQWSFVYPADLTNMKTTIGMLNSVQKSIAQNKNGMSLSYSVQGTQVSARLAQSQPCVIADLIADAKAQALKMAGAAGMGVGSILAVSSTTSTASASNSFSGSSGSLAYPNAQPVCSLTVKFALGAF